MKTLRLSGLILFLVMQQLEILLCVVATYCSAHYYLPPSLFFENRVSRHFPDQAKLYESTDIKIPRKVQMKNKDKKSGNKLW
jgi:hypothetical protein